MASEDSLFSLLASGSKRFDVEICVVSLQCENGDWKLHGDIDGWVQEHMEDSRLFKVLLRRAMPTVIPDAQLSSHLKDDPLVATSGGLQLRFYAEVPLLDRLGKIIGALILADRKPRPEDLHGSDLLELMGLFPYCPPLLFNLFCGAH